MKFKVYQSEEEKIEELHFKLKETNRNSVSLVIVNKNGFNISYGSILEISSEGVCMHSRVSDELGLPLDNRRRVTVMFEK